MNVAFVLQQSAGSERAGIMYLSSMLKQHGHDTKLFCTGNMKTQDVVAAVGEFSPGIVAYSVMTGEHYYYLDLNLKLKKHLSVFSIFGGPHPTFYPEMAAESGVDAVCVGEGEHALLELAEGLQHERSVRDIANLCFYDGATVIRNPVRPLNDDLDDLPFPDRALMYAGDPSLLRSEQRMFFAGRGCPYKCTYCFNHNYNELYTGKGRIVRHRTVDNLITEVLEVKERYGLEYVWIDDDSFTAKPRAWLQEFAHKFPQKVGLPINCNVRADNLTEENVELLRAAGCHSAWIGVECGNEKLARSLLQRNMSNEQIRMACSLLKKNGILFVTQNLCGLPVSNPLEIDLETLSLNLDLKPTFAWSSILYPYPGTPIATQATAEGYFPDTDYRTVPVSNKTKSTLVFRNPKEKAQVERLHKLFGLAVGFPVIVPIIRFLIRLPLMPLYQLAFFGWYGYCLKVRILNTKVFSMKFLRLSGALISYLRFLETKPSQ